MKCTQFDFAGPTVNKLFRALFAACPRCVDKITSPHLERDNNTRNLKVRPETPRSPDPENYLFFLIAISDPGVKWPFLESRIAL